MKLIREYTLQCDACRTHPYQINRCQSELATLIGMLAHIQQFHVTQYAKIEWEGRLLATSQNGNGWYKDYPICEPKFDGWSGAPKDFRDYWIMKAFENSLT
jgi:hypothetical protein